MRKKIGIIFAIIIILFGVYLMDKTLVMKKYEGITDLQDYYVQDKNTVDVLFIGSSHVGMNLDMAEIWNKYGISAYTLWGGGQPLWNTYYYLCEALKYQTPKVVVMDVLKTDSYSIYADEARQIKNNVAMRLNMNKLKSIVASAPSENWARLLLGYPFYHTRYTELTDDDFQHYLWNKDTLIVDKGTRAKYEFSYLDINDASDVTERAEIGEKQNYYLHKIIDKCKENNIELVFIKTPVSDRINIQPMMNTVSDIAKENDIPFINFNLMDEETGFTSRDFEGSGHLNTYGARKITNYLGKYIVDNYNVTDHRGDSRYSSWDDFSKYIDYNFIRMIDQSEDYFTEIREKGYSVIMLKDGIWGKMDSLDTLFANIEMDPLVVIDDKDSLWNLDSNLKLLEPLPVTEGSNSLMFYNNVVQLDLSDEVIFSMNENVMYQTGQRGIVFFIFDKNNELIDISEIFHYEDFGTVHHVIESEIKYQSSEN